MSNLIDQRIKKFTYTQYTIEYHKVLLTEFSNIYVDDSVYYKTTLSRIRLLKKISMFCN